ncbi:MAG: hypothetical protein LBT08_04515, partial [Synergistaceae bacterium]|jgi:hypothetical protein|nr:hypothetical protein [Synergistaceae bacterium]
VSCRLAIQLCVGYFSDGRERHRTFSIKNIRRDAGADAIAAVIRAIAPLLKYPITKVRLIKTDRLVLEKPASLNTPNTPNTLNTLNTPNTPNTPIIPILNHLRHSPVTMAEPANAKPG